MAAGGSRDGLRLAGLALVGAALAFQVFRTAAVADRRARPELAGILWPAHPAVLHDRALLDVATAASRQQGVPPATRADVRRMAAKAPLSPDPFLIEGAIAETKGRDRQAEDLLLAARQRDPRSRGTRFLLADRYLRSGRIAAGLMEMQALVSLQSRGVEAFAPALVAYAREPGAATQLRAFFRKYPRAEAGVLSALAVDAANADLVLQLASDDPKPEPDWRGTLVTSLTTAGQYRKAYEIWARLSHVRATGGLFNSGFAKLAAPAPFNWALSETSEGIAETSGKGGLDVLYYGRAKAVLASQLLILPPGAYRLSMRIDNAGSEGSVRWSLRCAGTQTALAVMPVRQGTMVQSFTVPAGCEAQWLELQGLPGETPKTTELSIRDLRLAAEQRP